MSSRTVLRSVVFGTAILLSFGHALGQPSTVSNGMVLVKPNGGKTVWTSANPESMLLKSDVTKTSKSVEQVLKDNGLAYDENARKMFEQLNPQIGSSGTLKAGTKFNVIGLDEKTLTNLNAENALLKFSGVEPTQIYSRIAVAESTKYRVLAAEYKSSTYATDNDQKAHLAALAQIEMAGKAFIESSNKLPVLEYMLAADRLEYANRKAAQIDRTVQAGGGIAKAQLALIQQAGNLLAPVTSNQRLTRTVKVTVTDSAGNPVKGLTVYSLPAPFFDDPGEYPNSYILERLIRYSSPQETSPSSFNVDGIDARLWIGPKKRYEEMVSMIKQRKLTGKYSTLNESTLGRKDVEIQLSAPSDVVLLP